MNLIIKYFLFMKKLKFLKYKKKNYNIKKIYHLKIATKKTTKINHSLILGTCFYNIKLYIFIYQKIISYFKLGSKMSKQFTLVSLFYLKNFLNKNLN